MVHHLTTKGEFHVDTIVPDGKGGYEATSIPGTASQLQGMLSYVHQATLFDRSLRKEFTKKFDTTEKVYRRFLFYNDLHSPDRPVVICEGKTDNIYIRAAIKALGAAHPALALPAKTGGYDLKIRLFKYTATAGRILHLTGGSGALCRLVQEYEEEYKLVRAAGGRNPVILLIDNDEGAKGIFGKLKVDGTQPFYHVAHNLYVVPTPLTGSGDRTMIEDFFKPATKATKLAGKSFHPGGKGFDVTKHYGKQPFAESVVRRHAHTIDFSGFAPILGRLEAVIHQHKPVGP
jgi:hypothetical protein